MARRASTLTEQQTKYVDEVLKGKSKNAAAKAAGYPNATAPEKSALVKIEIAEARAKLTDLTQITRVTVVDGIMDGIAMARMQGDATNVIKGWVEVSKILGYQAPEVKTVNLSLNDQRKMAKLEELSDAELIQLAFSNRDVADVVVKNEG